MLATWLSTDLLVWSLSAATFARLLKAGLFRRRELAHLTTVYFALYKFTHYYYWHIYIHGIYFYKATP